MHDWYAIRTKPSQESRAVLNLRRQGLEVLDPRYRVRHATFRPFFPNYIFTAFDPATPWLKKVRNTLGVRYVIGYGDVPSPVPVDFMTALRQRMDHRDVIILDNTREYTDLSEGQRVVLTTGEFAGYGGLFKGYVTGKYRANVLLDAMMLGTRPVITVPSRSLEVV